MSFGAGFVTGLAIGKKKFSNGGEGWLKAIVDDVDNKIIKIVMAKEKDADYDFVEYEYMYSTTGITKSVYISSSNGSKTKNFTVEIISIVYEQDSGLAWLNTIVSNNKIKHYLDVNNNKIYANDDYLNDIKSDINKTSERFITPLAILYGYVISKNDALILELDVMDNSYKDGVKDINEIDDGSDIIVVDPVDAVPWDDDTQLTFEFDNDTDETYTVTDGDGNSYSGNLTVGLTVQTDTMTVDGVKGIFYLTIWLDKSITSKSSVSPVGTWRDYEWQLKYRLYNAEGTIDKSLIVNTYWWREWYSSPSKKDLWSYTYRLTISHSGATAYDHVISSGNNYRSNVSPTGDWSTALRYGRYIGTLPYSD